MSWDAVKLFGISCTVSWHLLTPSVCIQSNLWSSGDDLASLLSEASVQHPLYYEIVQVPLWECKLCPASGNPRICLPFLWVPSSYCVQVTAQPKTQGDPSIDWSYSFFLQIPLLWHFVSQIISTLLSLNAKFCLLNKACPSVSTCKFQVVSWGNRRTCFICFVCSSQGITVLCCHYPCLENCSFTCFVGFLVV